MQRLDFLLYASHSLLSWSISWWEVVPLVVSQTLFVGFESHPLFGHRRTSRWFLSWTHFLTALDVSIGQLSCTNRIVSGRSQGTTACWWEDPFLLTIRYICLRCISPFRQHHAGRPTPSISQVTWPILAVSYRKLGWILWKNWRGLITLSPFISSSTEAFRAFPMYFLCPYCSSPVI